ncbi:uncharacterized protein STEHIDRAFT_168499 [Stereum hirsutum FP-91666 SS1]|uniref:uncharacterized protein n=1 Tax=Stereum hirsutum (strain FP-91666) TaxID=721885 RepID=UPI000440AB71|nr:uncharacterized protein STEHIDRAFT_168499 [Stereum hirsutum FP-91666 SS1]EIM86521.1 hypothetical protein STEHIDRAFT_168499 [Stereum hirsutum FP-91666 SS1]
MSLSTIPFPAPPSADVPDVTTPTTPVQATFLKPKSSPKRSKSTTNEPKRSKRVRFVDQPTLIYIPSPSSAFSPLLTPLFESLNSMPDSDAEDDESPASLSLYHSKLTHARSPMHQKPTPSMPSMSMLIQRPLPPSPTRSASPPPSPIPLPPPLPLPLPITPTASFQSDYDGDSDASIVFTPVSSKLAHLAPLMAPAPRRTRILSIGELSFASSSSSPAATPHSNEVSSFSSVLSPRPKLKTVPKPTSASMLSPTRIPLPLSPRAGTPVPLSPAPFTFLSSTHPRLRIETLHLNSSSHTQHQHRPAQTRLRPRERKVSGTSPNAISRHKLHGYGQKAGSALSSSKRVRRTSGEGMNVVKRNGVGRQRGGIPSWEMVGQEEEKGMGRIAEERERREMDEGTDLMSVEEEVPGGPKARSESAADTDFVRGVQDATRDLNEATEDTNARNVDPDVEPSRSFTTSTLPPKATTDDDSIISLTNSLLSESQSHLSSLEESYESLLELKDLFIRDLRFEIDDLRSELHLSQFEESKGRTRIRELEDQLVDMEEKLEEREAKVLEREREVTRTEGEDDRVQMEMTKETEVMEMRETLEGAERVAVMKTNRIVELEAELQKSNQVVTKSQLEVRSLEVERGQLQVEIGRLHDELESTSRAQEKLKDDLDQRKMQGDHAKRTLGMMEGGVRRIEGEIRALLELVERRGEEEESAIIVEEEDSVAESDEEGSVDTLVTAHETPSWATVTPPVENTDLKYFHQDEPEVPRPIQDIQESSYDERIRALEARLDGMRLRYEAAEASTVCGHDVDRLLRTQLGSLEEENGELRERIMEWEGRVGSEAEGESSTEVYGMPGSDFEGSEERWPDDVPLTMGVDSDLEPEPSFTQAMEKEMLTASSLPSSPTDETSNGVATRVAPRPVSWIYDTLDDDGLASSDELSKRTDFGALKSARKTWLLDEELPEGGAHASDFEDLSSSILRLRSPHPSKGLRGRSGPRSKM